MKRNVYRLTNAFAALLVLSGCSQKDNAPVPKLPAVSEQAKPVDSTPDPIKTINELVKSANANLPAMVDKQTRLDKVVAGPGAQLTYLYTLPDLASSDVSASWITVDVKPKVTRDVCDTPLLRRLLANGATLVYAYKGKDGVDINQFRITDGDCVRIGFK